MINKEKEIFESSLCIIKRPKNRGRFELYIFAEKFRNEINAAQFTIINEDLKELKPFKAKMLFKKMKYGIMLSKILDRINERMIRGEARDAVQLWLEGVNTELKNIHDSLDKYEFKSEIDFLEACYDRALSKLS